MFDRSKWYTQSFDTWVRYGDYGRVRHDDHGWVKRGDDGWVKHAEHRWVKPTGSVTLIWRNCADR